MPSYNNNLEDPLDLYIFRPIASLMVDPLHKLGLRPSNVTTISLIFAFISPILYIFNFIWLAALFYFIYYVLDCTDGQLARKYNQCSFFGAVYDWNKDHLVGLVFLIAFLFNSNYHGLLSILLLVMPMLLHIGTLDAITNLQATGSFKMKTNSTENNKNLFYGYYEFSKYICYSFFNLFFCNSSISKIYESIRFIRYFGTGIFTISIIFSMIHLEVISFFISLCIVISCILIFILNKGFKKK